MKKIALSNQGVLRAQHGDLKTGLADCNATLEQDASLAQLYVNRALVYLLMDAAPLALKDCKMALEIEHKNAQAHLAQGRAHAMLGDTHAALASYEHAISRDPHLAEIFAYRGLFFLKNNETQAALDDFEDALHLKPALHLARAGMALAYWHQGEHAKARSTWQALILRDARWAEFEFVTKETQGILGAGEVAALAAGDVAPQKAD